MNITALSRRIEKLEKRTEKPLIVESLALDEGETIPTDDSGSLLIVRVFCNHTCARGIDDDYEYGAVGGPE